MWLLFGNKTKVRPVPGGRTIERRCDECRQVRRFVECDVADEVSLFAVSLFDMEHRRMVCPECGEDFEVPPAPAAQPSKPVTSPPTASAPQPRTPSDGDLDKMLADLKKKMGK
jgi:predicted RNA-binding Zn-ribbon protein involved in translation (DUF1610 family)